MNGVSIRKVTKIVETLCRESVFKSFVSSLTAKLDPITNDWASRQINTMSYLYIFMDVLYIKLRENLKVVPKAVYIDTAISEGNRREVLGLKVDTAEDFEAWQSFIQELKSRGLQSPELIISDAHEGLKKAVICEFTDTSWQRSTPRSPKTEHQRLS